MEKKIQQLIKKYNTNCPFEISDALGINVSFSDLGKVTRGLYYRKLRRRFIVIHTDLDFIWKRFVCAHELGHDFLHPKLNGFWLDQNALFNPGKFEQQANRFALLLLSAGEKPGAGETIREFCIRYGIPYEMHKYLL